MCADLELGTQAFSARAQRETGVRTDFWIPRLIPTDNLGLGNHAREKVPRCPPLPADRVLPGEFLEEHFLLKILSGSSPVPGVIDNRALATIERYASPVL